LPGGLGEKAGSRLILLVAGFFQRVDGLAVEMLLKGDPPSTNEPGETGVGQCDQKQPVPITISPVLVIAVVAQFANATTL
jgi:hypothetical protein